MPSSSLKAQLLLLAVAVGLISVRGEEHHVVGGDRGWDPSNDLASWASPRIFRVGDKLWFTYSAAHEQVMELRTKEEYEACDVNNPMKKYVDGIDNVLLDGEGIRYFVSNNIEKCRGGLKLHVEVMPRHHHPQQTTVIKEVAADGPTPSAAAAHVGFSTFLSLIFLLYCMLA